MNRDRKAHVRVVALLAALVLAAAACGGDGGDDAGGNTPGTSAATPSTSPGGASNEAGPAPRPLAERTSVTIVPAVAIENFAPAYLAETFGEYEKENLDVEITNLPPNEGYLLLEQGKVHLQVGGINSGFLNLVASGGDLRWVGGVFQQSDENREGLYVRNEVFEPDGSVDPQRFSSMRMAIGAAGVTSPSVLPAYNWVVEEGGDFAAVEQLNLGGSEIMIALEQGSIDAGYVLTPFWTEIEASGCCRLVTPVPALAASTYTMSKSFIDDEPEVAEAILRALSRTAATYLQGNYYDDPEVMAALVETMGIPAESFTASPPLVFPPGLDLDVALAEQMQEIWQELGVLSYSELLPIDEVTDLAVRDRAIAGS